MPKKRSLIICECGDNLKSVSSAQTITERYENMDFNVQKIKKVNGYGYCWNCKKMFKLVARAVDGKDVRT